ncbi:MAG: hypothetical protein LKI17_07790 [Megasphaera cerevisiae]|nr:hypothetical protein [Megasphaera cerevisiae]
MKPSYSNRCVLITDFWCDSAIQTNTDFHFLIEAIANDFVNSDIPDEQLKEINDIFDDLDDELLAMHENFCVADDNIEWIDDVFRKSLALIQVETKYKDNYINLLQARTKALLNRLPNQIMRKKIVASDIPLSVSKAIFDDIDKFRELASLYVLSSDINNQINDIVREIEIWSNSNASNLMKFVPTQEVLDSLCYDWISGVSLAEMAKSKKRVEIVKDYYGFTLPWIIHAISQMFDSESEAEIAKTYASIAMFVELGLPNQIAVNIYMAGIRSRSVALELSALEIFQNKNVSEIKRIIVNFPLQDVAVSDNVRTWIELLSNSTKAKIPKTISFPVFRWNKANLPNKLYMRAINEDCFLFSSDGYFFEKIKSTRALPFFEIANIKGLYFECENKKWYLKSYNPMVVIE